MTYGVSLNNRTSLSFIIHLMLVYFDVESSSSRKTALVWSLNLLYIFLWLAIHNYFSFDCEYFWFVIYFPSYLYFLFVIRVTFFPIFYNISIILLLSNSNYTITFHLILICTVHLYLILFINNVRTDIEKTFLTFHLSYILHSTTTFGKEN